MSRTKTTRSSWSERVHLVAVEGYPFIARFVDVGVVVVVVVAVMALYASYIVLVSVRGRHVALLRPPQQQQQQHQRP